MNARLYFLSVVWIDLLLAEVLNQFLESAQEKNSEFYERLKEAVRNPLGGWGGTVRLIVLSFVGLKNDPDEDIYAVSIEKILKFVIEESEAVMYVAERMERLLQLKDLIRDRRLKNFMDNSGVARPYQDLSRSFFKVLAELRKQQEWRYQKSLIDVDATFPVPPAKKSRKN